MHLSDRVGSQAYPVPTPVVATNNDAEITELMELGAIGEIAGWAYDRHGILISGGTNSQVAGVPLEQSTQRLVVGVAGGLEQVESILAALRGKLMTGLIIDDVAAQAILSND